MTVETIETRQPDSEGRDPSSASFGDWRHRAACREEDPELFHPVGNTGVALLQIEDAKAVCARCPVTAACLDFAIKARMESGIWAGTTEEDRQSMRRRESRERSKAAERDQPEAETA